MKKNYFKAYFMSPVAKSGTMTSVVIAAFMTALGAPTLGAMVFTTWLAGLGLGALFAPDSKKIQAIGRSSRNG